MKVSVPASAASTPPDTGASNITGVSQLPFHNKFNQNFTQNKTSLISFSLVLLCQHTIANMKQYFLSHHKFIQLPNKKSHLIYSFLLPCFSFDVQLEIAREIFLDVCGSIVDESIKSHGRNKLPP